MKFPILSTIVAITTSTALAESLTCGSVQAIYQDAECCEDPTTPTCAHELSIGSQELALSDNGELTLDISGLQAKITTNTALVTANTALVTANTAKITTNTDNKADKASPTFTGTTTFEGPVEFKKYAKVPKGSLMKIGDAVIKNGHEDWDVHVGGLEIHGRGDQRTNNIENPGCYDGATTATGNCPLNYNEFTFKFHRSSIETTKLEINRGTSSDKSLEILQQTGSTSGNPYIRSHRGSDTNTYLDFHNHGTVRFYDRVSIENTASRLDVNTLLVAQQSVELNNACPTCNTNTYGFVTFGRGRLGHDGTTYVANSGWPFACNDNAYFAGDWTEVGGNFRMMGGSYKEMQVGGGGTDYGGPLKFIKLNAAAVNLYGNVNLYGGTVNLRGTVTIPANGVHSQVQFGTYSWINLADVNGVGIPGGSVHTDFFNNVRFMANVWAIGGGTHQASDERIKENMVLADLEEVLQRVRDIDMKKYNYKGIRGGDIPVFGFSAQQVESVMPEAVKTGPNYNITYADESTEEIVGLQTIDKSKVFALHHGAIQALDGKIAALQEVDKTQQKHAVTIQKHAAAISTLESTIAALEEKIAALVVQKNNTLL